MRVGIRRTCDPLGDSPGLLTCQHDEGSPARRGWGSDGWGRESAVLAVVQSRHRTGVLRESQEGSSRASDSSGAVPSRPRMRAREEKGEAAPGAAEPTAPRPGARRAEWGGEPRSEEAAGSGAAAPHSPRPSLGGILSHRRTRLCRLWRGELAGFRAGISYSASMGPGRRPGALGSGRLVCGQHRSPRGGRRCPAAWEAASRGLGKPGFGIRTDTRVFSLAVGKVVAGGADEGTGQEEEPQPPFSSPEEHLTGADFLWSLSTPQIPFLSAHLRVFALISAFINVRWEALKTFSPATFLFFF